VDAYWIHPAKYWVGCYENCNEPSEFINGREFVYQLSDF
jgi:hypothetical protein